MEKKVSTPMLEGNVETVPGMPLLITEIPETKDTEPPSANPDPTPNDATPSKESDTESPSNILATESTPLKETDGKSPHVLSTEPTPKEMHSENSRKEAAFDPFAIENSYSDLMDRKVSTSSQSSRDTILKPWVKQVSVTVKRRNENSMSFNTRPLSMDLDTEFYAKSKSELPNLQIEVPKIQLPDTEGKEGERKNSSEINREDTVENPNIHQAQSEAAGSEQQPDLDPVETVGELRKEVEKALTREITLGKAMIERSKSNLALAKTKSNIALAKTKSNIALAIVETPEVESAAAKKAEADEEGDYVAPVLQSHSRKSMVLNNLSISEKVVGSFLFLRFIVPGK